MGSVSSANGTVSGSCEAAKHKTEKSGGLSEGHTSDCGSHKLLVTLVLWDIKSDSSEIGNDGTGWGVHGI